MYSLTFCVRVMSPERHHWKPAVQSRPQQRANTPPSVRTMLSYRGMDASL